MEAHHDNVGRMIAAVFDEDRAHLWRTTAAWAIACATLFVTVLEGLPAVLPALGRLSREQRLQLSQMTVNFCDHAILGPMAVHVMVNGNMKLVSGTSATIDWISMSVLGFCTYDLTVRVLFWRVLWRNSYFAHHAQSVICLGTATLVQLLGFERAFASSLMLGDMLTSGRVVLKLCDASGFSETSLAQMYVYHSETVFFVFRIFWCFGILWRFFTDAEASPLLEKLAGTWGWWLIVGTFLTFVVLCLYWLSKKLKGIQRRHRESAQRAKDGVSPVSPQGGRNQHVIAFGLLAGAAYLVVFSFILSTDIVRMLSLSCTAAAGLRVFCMVHRHR